MRPVSLTLHNFGSFIGPETFHFPDGPGLYFMCGQNDLEPRLGGNGAGKSTLWKAFCWLFFERTSAGLKAGDICNWDVEKGASVSFNFEDTHGLPHTVMRSWAPNKWTHTDGATGHTHDLTKGGENAVLAMLRLNFAAFTQTIVMPQDSELFMDLKGDTQTALFGDVMKLDKWVDYSDKAAARAKSEDSDCRRLERELANVQGKVDAAKLALVWEGDSDWQREHDKKVDGIQQEYDNLLTRRRTVNGSRLDAEDDVVKLRIVLAGLSDLSALEKAHTDAKETHAETRDLAARAEGANNALAERRGLLTGKSVCPTCEQPIGNCGATAKQIQRELDERVKAIMKLWEEEAMDRDHVTQCFMNLDLARKKVQEVQSDIRQAEQTARNLARDVADLDKRLDALEAQSDAADKEVNPFGKMRKDAEANLARHEAHEQDLRRQVDAAAFKYSVCSNWVKWFKDIRLEQVNEALNHLAIEVNNQVEALGLTGWDIMFGVDRETKGGSVQRGFTATVRSPRTEKRVPWKAWSGGERQRLTIAPQMGLAELIRSRSGCPLNLEVWDEPTKGMSPQGVQDLLEALHNRAQREGRQIWIVDHHTLGFNKFAGSVCVVKDINGSRFDFTDMPV